MHEQSRTGIDFDHSATCFMQGAADIFCHDVNACDVKTDHASSQCGSCCNIWMNFVGHIQIEVAIALHYYFTFFLDHAMGFESLALNF